MKQRTWIAWLPVFALFLTTLYAQTDSTAYRPSTYIGAQYGMNWNEVMFSPRVAQTRLSSNRLAAVLRYASEPHLGVQVELAYDRRGWAESIDSLSTNYTREIDYLDLGAYTHISVGKGVVRPVILLGSYLSYPVRQTETIPPDWDPLRFSYYGESLPDRLQYGLTGGLGLEVVLGGVVLQLDGRYQAALSGLFAADDPRFIFSNPRGVSAQATCLFRLFGG